ncbi:probable 2-polyprenyl-6-methoxyphenol hydroxylase and related FAD-dependent oxidoreductases [Phialocephala subalpina]|uniref:Probable 2-polyprenyl-6-methoxyphenol hydroxylase and related FAD-dependent oxidoreductases n=1 Tax=Phialocephala subalpina TaxID=576137 RepID=A0A1L7XFR5_9HELO|nr:probable 2-polyprenyl-6-methoxyphenol hydroxylase and related FAD-dependent oxidoreductases [Phialocephala subalpina]
MVQNYDVIICGSGSAGLCAAVWLARLGIKCKILEKSSGPMKMGQADGVQCRTVEMYESFGLSEDLLKTAYHVLEIAFWTGDEKGNLARTNRTADTMPGLSHMPHCILNQAVMNRFLLEAMERWNGQKVDYGYVVKGVGVDEGGGGEYPVIVTAEKDGVEEVFRAKYALGCDGAHSSVRRSLGYKMLGDSTDSIWGVMDIYPRTNFPDIRKKCTVHSKAGIIMIIPREGGSLVRFYIQLPVGTIAKDVKLPDLHYAAQQIFHPFTMEISETFWWSAYAIGQRLADHFSKDNRVFLTGDACHTHSPKAGQGMNVSLQDGYNMGWKLAAVLQGRASPELLKSYNLEREKVASDLISFDRTWTKLFSSKSSDNPDFREHFVKAGKYTAGLTAKYDDSVITSAAKSKQELAKGLVVGMRFPSAQVVRFCDARAMQLVRALPADGRWRVVVFVGGVGDERGMWRLNKLAEFLDSKEGPVHRFTLSNHDIDSFIEPIVVFHGERVKLEQEQIPEYFWPTTGKWRMRDLHKTFVDDESYNSGHGHAYEKYGVDVNEGAVVVVRPDQYVSLVTSLNDHKGLMDFFEGWVLPPPQEGTESKMSNGEL